MARVNAVRPEEWVGRTRSDYSVSDRAPEPRLEVCCRPSACPACRLKILGLLSSRFVATMPMSVENASNFALSKTSSTLARRTSDFRLGNQRLITSGNATHVGAASRA